MIKLDHLLVAMFGVLLVLNGCLARQSLGVPPQLRNECNLDNLDVLQATETIKSEAGQIEYWDHNHPQIRCAGVSVSRLVIEQGGLYLPTFFSSPKISYVVQGMGISGRVIPGCAETFMDSQPMQGQQQGQGQQGQQGQEGQQGQQGQQQQQGQQGFRDMHQKVEHVRHGDVIAITPGSAHWIYNTGDQPLVIISLLDIANYQNQLDRNPRVFRLAGSNPQGGFGGPQQQQPQQNMLNGFDPQVLAQALKIDVRLAEELQNKQDNRGNIVRVRGPFQVARPPLRQSYESEKWRHPRGPPQSPQDNGLEETICSMRTHENIDDPARADVYKPNLGRVTSVNSLTLPILQFVRLSATRGIIQGNAMVLPKYNMNANEILYCTRGQARIQVVNDNGQNVLDQQVQKGQLVVIPQGFAYVVQSQNNFEWISFKTNANAMISTLAGRTSALRALPLEVLTNAYQISLEEARRIKFNTLETTLTHARSGQQQLIDQIVEA
ncbi:cruciferin CRU1-like isoform X1 [Brassica napus]|uniref:cruciferin CRU1-like isoform X1 n=1 Tax=Brassica napus TaxID=3708 RepID=UPI002078CCCC|nr:cruciferin CRU1-like isoform X1 [Brassica napus]